MFLSCHDNSGAIRNIRKKYISERDTWDPKKYYFNLLVQTAENKCSMFIRQIKSSTVSFTLAPKFLIPDVYLILPRPYAFTGYAPGKGYCILLPFQAVHSRRFRQMSGTGELALKRPRELKNENFHSSFTPRKTKSVRHIMVFVL